MIHSIKFKDKFPTKYNGYSLSYFDRELSHLEGKEFKFTNKINIIVGSNGCGKSSILKLFKSILQINDRMYSQTHTTMSELRDMKDVMNIADIKASYSVTAFQLISGILNNDPKDIFEFQSVYEANSSSSGQSRVVDLNALWSTMFGPENTHKLKYELVKNDEFYEYVKSNIYTDETAYTVLMDEPDQNMDIYNLDYMYGILSEAKDYTQLIVVLHNVALIKKLIGNPDINFIELEDGYLNKIKEF